MTTVSSKTHTFTNGTANDAGPVESEMTTLFTNDQTLATAVTNLESNNMTIAGVKTFSSNPKMDGVAESTSGQGVTVDGARFIDGVGNLAPILATISSVDTTTDVLTLGSAVSPATETAVKVRADKGSTLDTGLSETTTYYWRQVSSSTGTLHPTAADATANTNTVNITAAGSGTRHLIATPSTLREGDVFVDHGGLKVRRAGATYTVKDTGNAEYPKGFINGKAPTYTAAGQITIPSGFRVRSSDNTADIEFTANQVVDLAVSGAGGLDTGAEAANTWYYVYAIKNTTSGAVSAVFSTVNEASTGSITLPSGYTVKRQLPIAVRNDGSSNIIPFYVANGWPHRPFVHYDATIDDISGTSGTNVLNGGSATVFTAVSATSYVPPISRHALLFITNNFAGSNSLYVRATGAVNNGKRLFLTMQNATQETVMDLNATQQFDYKVVGASADVAISGFVVTEVN